MHPNGPATSFAIAKVQKRPECHRWMRLWCKVCIAEAVDYYSALQRKPCLRQTQGSPFSTRFLQPGVLITEWCCPQFQGFFPAQLTQKLPHRYTQKVVFWVILDPVKLPFRVNKTELKSHHFVGLSLPIEASCLFFRFLFKKKMIGNRFLFIQNMLITVCPPPPPSGSSQLPVPTQIHTLSFSH